jgi:hypothetical protein
MVQAHGLCRVGQEEHLWSHLPTLSGLSAFGKKARRQTVPLLTDRLSKIDRICYTVSARPAAAENCPAPTIPLYGIHYD